MSGTVERKDDFVVKDAAGRERLQCAALTIIPDSGTAARDSVLCLGTVNDKFLKCRINDQPAGRGRSAALSHRLDAAAVGAAVKHGPIPVRRPRQAAFVAAAAVAAVAVAGPAPSAAAQD